MQIGSLVAVGEGDHLPASTIRTGPATYTASWLLFQSVFVIDFSLFSPGGGGARLSSITGTGQLSLSFFF